MLCCALRCYGGELARVWRQDSVLRDAEVRRCAVLCEWRQEPASTQHSTAPHLYIARVSVYAHLHALCKQRVCVCVRACVQM